MRVRFRQITTIVVGWIIATRIGLFLRGALFKGLLGHLRQPHQSPLAEPILKSLNQALREGHTCLPLKELAAQVKTEAGLSHLSPDEVMAALRQLRSRRQVR